MPIKPLTTSSISALMTRIDNARHSELRSITPHSPTSISIRFSVQDSARGFDWIDVVFRIDGVTDAKLVGDNVLASVDMSDGITVECDHNSCGIAIGNYTKRLSEAAIYVIGTAIGYEEATYGN